MGLVFLRHAYSRFLKVKAEIEPALPSRGGVRRELTKEDFSQKSAIFLRPESQYVTLAALPTGADLPMHVSRAMEAIEDDYEAVKGALPKAEYQKLGSEVLSELLRKLNHPELEKVSGDVFGRIYEYFLTQFADQKAHDGGEFFTPVSLVSLIAHVLDPKTGTVLDPACGSGGMFVQSARTVEEQGLSPTERLRFCGTEKNETTIALARMNLAVHGLQGNIKQANSYYADPHELLGKADFVMANPPFNVDEIDAEKVKSDPRLPFGLPGVNKKGKVSNGNYVWISHFYSYLKPTGRAGFVMSSQSSSAGRQEALVRRKLIETGDVDIMIAIRSNFFYTRTVPCELWFFDRAKPEERRDKVLMIDARSIYHKVTTTIYDFSPEQQQNLLAIVWLYRGEAERYLRLLEGYCSRVVDEAQGSFGVEDDLGASFRPLFDFDSALATLQSAVQPFLASLNGDGPHTAPAAALEAAFAAYETDVAAFRQELDARRQDGGLKADRPAAYAEAAGRLAPLAQMAKGLAGRVDALQKSALGLIETCEKECGVKGCKAWVARDVARAKKQLEAAAGVASEQLAKPPYFLRQAEWLISRFPDAVLQDVEGLVKLVDRAEIEANDWSLTPGRYVGVAPPEEEEGFDFAEAMRSIHAELATLDAEAATLAATIQRNFEELGL